MIDSFLWMVQILVRMLPINRCNPTTISQIIYVLSLGDEVSLRRTMQRNYCWQIVPEACSGVVVGGYCSGWVIQIVAGSLPIDARLTRS